MATFDSLIREAEEAAQWRGHTLGAWKPDSYWQTRMHADCTVCGAGVSVDVSPPPNGIDIAGSAVAINCKVPA